VTLRNKLYVLILAITVGLATSAGLAFVGGAAGFIAVGLNAAGLLALAMLASQCLNNSSSIEGLARLLKRNSPDGRSSENIIATDLCKALDDLIHGYTRRIDTLEKQTANMQMKLQLSRKEKKNVEAIICSISDAVIVTDDFGNLVIANMPAANLFGFDIKDCREKPIAQVIGNGEFCRLISNSRSTRTRHNRHELAFKKSEGESTYDCIISCIYDENKLVSGVIAVLHDVTREKEVSRMKNEFVSHVSHELKTPLASITAYAEMLVDGEAADEKTRGEFYSVIQSQAQRLNRLIEDILNVSRIESGLVKVEKTPVSMAMVIKECIKMMKTQAEEKNVQLIEQIPILHDQVMADRDMISRVVINLLSNAIKYTRSGGLVSVTCEVGEPDISQRTGEGIVRISVLDTGVGIPAGEIQHVFEKFYRVAANNKYAKGTGLGLNLVKQIVEKVHGGRVFVESKVGKGSTFGFELPLLTRQTTEACR
jgi:two-component system, OmpR family, phosphate regulon sensor histidine kinase PhoR